MFDHTGSMKQRRAQAGERPNSHTRQQCTQRNEMKLVALGIGRESIRHPGVQLVDQLWPIRGGGRPDVTTGSENARMNPA